MFLKHILSEILLNEDSNYLESLPQRLEKKLIMMQDAWDEKNGGKIKSLKQNRDAEVQKYYDAYDSGKYSKDELAKLKEQIKNKYSQIQSQIDKEREKAHKDREKKDESYKKDSEDYNNFEALDNKFIENKMDINKLSPEEQSEYKRLSVKLSPIKLTKRPGEVLQITTMDMGGANGKILAQEYQKEIINFKKSNFENGKPKGVILDNRLNIGGSQDSAKGILDFFVDGDEYPIEVQKFNYGARRFDTLKQYTDTKWDDQVMDKLAKMTEKEKQDYWQKSKDKGYFEVENFYKSKLKKEDKFTDIPVVVQTSAKTFSAGEFLSDSVKNLNPNAVQIGNNTGGGANQTYDGLTPEQSEQSDKLTPTQNAKNVADAYRYVYQNEETGKRIWEAIMSKINKGEINDKMSMKDMAKAAQDIAFETSKDPHVEVTTYEKDGKEKLFVGVPQVRSDRVIVDRKTKKPIKDKDGNYQFDGNWDMVGVGAGDTSPFLETDANQATTKSLDYIYKKNKNEDLRKELKSNPKKFGITKDGKDGMFDDSEEQHQSWHVSGETLYDHSIDLYLKTKKNAAQNKGGNDTDKIEKLQNDFVKKPNKVQPKNKLSNLIPKKVLDKMLKDKEPKQTKNKKADKLKSILPKDILDKTVKNPKTDNDIKISSALTYDTDSQVYKAARDYIKNNYKK